MSIVSICFAFSKGMGKIAGISSRTFKRGSQAVGVSMKRLKPLSSAEKIRAIVLEELTTKNSDSKSVTKEELEQRLLVLTNTILVLQEKLSKMDSKTPATESGIFASVASPLNKEDKAILSRIFRHNLAIQKPERAKGPTQIKPDLSI